MEFAQFPIDSNEHENFVVECVSLSLCLSLCVRERERERVSENRMNYELLSAIANHITTALSPRKNMLHCYIIIAGCVSGTKMDLSPWRICGCVCI